MKQYYFLFYKLLDRLLIIKINTVQPDAAPFVCSSLNALASSLPPRPTYERTLPCPIPSCPYYSNPSSPFAPLLFGSLTDEKETAGPDRQRQSAMYAHYPEPTMRRHDWVCCAIHTFEVNREDDNSTVATPAFDNNTTFR